MTINKILLSMEEKNLFNCERQHVVDNKSPQVVFVWYVLLLNFLFSEVNCKNVFKEYEWSSLPTVWKPDLLCMHCKIFNF